MRINMCGIQTYIVFYYIYIFILIHYVKKDAVSPNSHHPLLYRLHITDRMHRRRGLLPM